jgi:hypothetical protein
MTTISPVCTFEPLSATVTTLDPVVVVNGLFRVSVAVDKYLYGVMSL